MQATTVADTPRYDFANPPIHQYTRKRHEKKNARLKELEAKIYITSGRTKKRHERAASQKNQKQR